MQNNVLTYRITIHYITAIYLLVIDDIFEGEGDALPNLSLFEAFGVVGFACYKCTNIKFIYYLIGIQICQHSKKIKFLLSWQGTQKLSHLVPPFRFLPFSLNWIKVILLKYANIHTVTKKQTTYDYIYKHIQINKPFANLL